MKKKIISIPSVIPGCMNHYDGETGKLVGYSMPGLVSGVTEHFSADGSDLGYSVDGLLGGRNHYDENGRHSYLTYLAGTGTDTKTLQTIAGHSTIGMTMNHYVHAQPDKIKAAGKQMHDLLAG